MTIPEGGKGERSEEELFRQLVGDAVQKEGEMLWDENLMLQEDPEAEVPADADQRIRAAIHRAFVQRRRKRALRAAACLLLVSIASASAILAASPQARATVWRWAAQAFDKSIAYRFNGESETPELPDLQLSVIPEGYEYTDSVENENKRVLLYTNLETRQYLRLSYNLMQDKTNILLFGEAADVQEVEVNGCPGSYYQRATGEDNNALAWADEEAGILYVLDGPFTEEELQEIAGTIQLQ